MHGGSKVNKAPLIVTSQPPKKANIQVQEDKNEIPDDVKQRFFVNVPFFDFIYAEEELGFNFNEFAKNSFGDFIEMVYVQDLIGLRKAYIQRDMIRVRFLAHKFKSPFK